MTTRRSSIYNLRVRTVVPNVVLADLSADLKRLSRLVYNLHTATEDHVSYATIGFRAKDDTEALAIADEIGSRYAGRTVLMTGHGIHRRTVAN